MWWSFAFGADLSRRVFILVAFNDMFRVYVYTRTVFEQINPVLEGHYRPIENICVSTVIPALPGSLVEPLAVSDRVIGWAHAPDV
jgi:hypothetical protein